MPYTAEREELFTALQQVITAAPHRASPEHPPWLELIEPGAELDLAQVTEAYHTVLESERLQHDDSVHLAGLWFEFGAWCSDQSRLAEWGRLLLVRFGLELGLIVPEQVLPDARAEQSLQTELERAIAQQIPADIDLSTCLNLISRAHEAVHNVDTVEQAFRLVLLANKLAHWASTLRQPAVRAEAEDVARDANETAELLATPLALRRMLDSCDDELAHARTELADTKSHTSRMREVAERARRAADWAGRLSLETIRDTALSIAHQAETMARDGSAKGPINGTAHMSPVRPTLSTATERTDTDRLGVPKPSAMVGTPTPAELADTDCLDMPRPSDGWLSSVRSRLSWNRPSARNLRRKAARGLVAVSAAAAIFIAGWVLHGQEGSIEPPVEVHIPQTTPGNTHYISLEDQPTEIVVRDYLFTVEKRPHRPSVRNAVHIVGEVRSMTFVVEGGQTPITLKME